MGFWSGLAKGAMNMARGAGDHVFKPIGRSAVNSIANPTTAINNAAKTAKAAALPAAGGYIAWQNLANDKSALESVKDVVVGEDKSAVEAVSDVAIGEKNTERIANLEIHIHLLVALTHDDAGARGGAGTYEHA